MGWNLRALLSGLAAAAMLGASASPQAKDFPQQPVHIVVPYSAGGPTDIHARKIADDLSRRLGQPVVIDNRPGANGIIAAESVARAKPDGYTIGLFPAPVLCVNPALHAKLSYDTKRDFKPITRQISGTMLLFVAAAFPARTLAEFVGYVKERPGDITFASGGVGGADHLAMEELQRRAGLKMIHVPFKGGSELAADVAAGRSQVGLLSLSALSPHLQSGRVRALAVLGPTRLPLAPDVPTTAEAGMPEWRADTWGGYVAPAGTPDAVVARLHAALKAAIEAPAYRSYIESLGGTIIADSPDEFARVIDADLAHWSGLVRDIGLKVE